MVTRSEYLPPGAPWRDARPLSRLRLRSGRQTTGHGRSLQAGRRTLWAGWCAQPVGVTTRHRRGRFPRQNPVPSVTTGQSVVPHGRPAARTNPYRPRSGGSPEAAWLVFAPAADSPAKQHHDHPNQASDSNFLICGCEQCLAHQSRVGGIIEGCITRAGKDFEHHRPNSGAVHIQARLTARTSRRKVRAGERRWRPGGARSSMCAGPRAPRR